MLSESLNLAIYRTELDRVFFQEFDWNEGQLNRASYNTPAIFRQIDISDRTAYIEEIGVGVGLFTKLSEGQALPAANPNKMADNKATYYVAMYGQQIEITKQAFDDDALHHTWANKVKDAALKARITMETEAFNLWNNAFTTTLCADGTSLIGTHTLLNGSTISNDISGALSNDNINKGVYMLMQQKDQAGVILGNRAAALLVPVQLFQKAIQFTESALIVDSSAAQNAVNVWKSAMGIQVYTSPYLTSTTAWFLLGSKHSVTRLFRQGVETALVGWQYSNNLTYSYKVNYRETYFVSDYAGVVGSAT